jgi:hypothetical protein
MIIVIHNLLINVKCKSKGHRVFRLYSSSVWANNVAVKWANNDSPLQPAGYHCTPCRGESCTIKAKSTKIISVLLAFHPSLIDVFLHNIDGIAVIKMKKQ